MSPKLKKEIEEIEFIVDAMTGRTVTVGEALPSDVIEKIYYKTMKFVLGE